MNERKYAVAIDGPSGAGKSTLAKAAAERLGILYVDTGAIYRTIGLYVQRHGIDPKDSTAVLAALPEQVETVLNRRYRETGKARVFTITDAALRELLGSTAPYAPPDLPFYTSEGSVLDVPPLKAP